MVRGTVKDEEKQLKLEIQSTLVFNKVFCLLSLTTSEKYHREKQFGHVLDLKMKTTIFFEAKK